MTAEAFKAAFRDEMEHALKERMSRMTERERVTFLTACAIALSTAATEAR